MRELSEGVASRIILDSAMIGYLGTTDGAPSVFEERPVPEEAQRPLVIVGPVVADNNVDTVSIRGRIVQLDIMIVGKRQQRQATYDAAERVLSLVHRGSVDAGVHWRTMIMTASGPIAAPAEDDEVAWVVRLSTRLYSTGQ